jgi:pimeloyl-ACP methyl ester carboxylesterase
VSLNSRRGTPFPKKKITLALDYSMQPTIHAVSSALVNTAMGPVEYAVAGSGDPILYFHGSGAANDLIFCVEGALLRDGFRLVVPNRPGYGNTPLSSGRSSSECADLAAALLEELDIRSAVVMGCSGGGLFAARFAERHPTKTLCLVLQCAQTHRWDGPSWLPEHSRWTYPFLGRPVWRRLLLAAYRWKLKFAQPLWLLQLESGRRIDEARGNHAALELSQITLDFWKECQKRSDGFRNDFEILLGEDLLLPGTVKCPTLVIHDSLDPMAPARHRDWTIECIPHAERCDVHALGHLIWIGAGTEAMYRQRVEFLRRHAGSHAIT